MKDGQYSAVESRQHQEGHESSAAGDQAQKHPLEHPKIIGAFSKVSKGVLYFPLAILALAAVVVWGDYKTKVQEARILAAVTPTRIPIPTLIPDNANATGSVRFTLAGPVLCDHQSKEASISAAVLNRNIAVTIREATTTSRFLVKGDCVYSWRQGESVGVKRCGIGQILSMLDFISGLRSLSVDSLFDMIPGAKLPDAVGRNADDVEQFKKSCSNKKPDKSTFELPETVTFAEKAEN